ncbi:hypothetical protein [Streptomyces sp. NPDC059398]|uniref:hypothetical protein n=1 Tax=Streptomyces sp. NPDC059398 TaxID=3346820 RepID=UPI0036C3FF60
MRSLSSSPAPGRGPSAGALTTTETVVVVVVLVVATVLAATGKPMPGALEFITGALYVSCRYVRAVRAAARLPHPVI